MRPCRSRILLMLFLCGAILAATVSHARAQGCSCQERSAEEIFASADTVIDGLVVEVQQRANKRVAFVAVVAVYLGEADDLLRIRLPGPRCGLDPRAGERWVFVGSMGRTWFHVGMCSGSSSAATLIEGRNPIEPEVTPIPPDGTGSSRGSSAAIVALALAVVASFLILVRDRLGRR